MNNSKVVTCDSLGFELLDRIDTGIAWTLPQLAAQTGDILRATRGEYLYRTVITIADPTCDSQTYCRALHEPPESNALHLPANHKALSDLVFTGHRDSGYENFTRPTMQYFPPVYAFRNASSGIDCLFTTTYLFGPANAISIL
jgi:hypothetical protein